MNKKIIFGIVALTILGLFVSGCASTNCKNSGGVWKYSVSETYGKQYFCDCPDGKYSMNEVCKTITQTEINACQQEISNSDWTCGIEGSDCVCRYGQEASALAIQTILKCDCNCYSNSCGCDC